MGRSVRLVRRPARGEDAVVHDEVTIRQVTARPTAVVPASTSWQEFPRLWGKLLGEVWDCLRAAGITSGCRNRNPLGGLRTARR